MTAGALIGCPRCETRAESIGLLAAHLANDHLISASSALAEAQAAGAPTMTAPVTPAAAPPASEPPAPKETPMPKPTKECKWCAKKAPEKCRRHTGGGTRARAKKPKPTPRKARAVREALSLNGDNSARKAAQALVDQLHRLRAKLDEKIHAVQELVEIL